VASESGRDATGQALAAALAAPDAMTPDRGPAGAPRTDPPFVQVHLSGHAKGAFTGAANALPGLVREADGGTLVLDEIGELPLSLQPKLLRVLEERTIRPVGAAADAAVSVRFVGTTNADLHLLSRKGRFRADLLGRLSAWTIAVPGLDARRPDLIDLADAVAPRARADGVRSSGVLSAARPWHVVLDARSIEKLLLVEWQFNLRSLQAVLVQIDQRLTEGRSPIQATDAALDDAGLVRADRGAALPGHSARLATPPGLAATERYAQVPPPVAAWRPDAALLRSLLAEHKGSIERVAEALGRNRRQVYRWMQYAGISEQELRSVRRKEP